MTLDIASSKVGRTVLFLGTETVNWTLAEFHTTAQFARDLGVDSLAVKCADGSILWYGSIGGAAAVKQVVQFAGCGFVPYAYCYGDKFGFGALEQECAVLAQLMRTADNCVCADLEAEFNGRPDWAMRFAAAMGPVPGLLYLSTWADPNQQAWDGVTRALAPCVDAWSPQQYTNWLAAQESQLTALGESPIQPTVDLSAEFGPNDPAAIARAAVAHGHTTVWLWELAAARANPNLVRAIVEVMAAAGEPAPAPTPAPAPAPAPAPRTFRVTHWPQPGSSLTSIAELVYGDATRWPAIYAANRALIGSNPDMIRADEVLVIP